ncbi:MAG: hypothetical protein ACLFPL_04080 [Candidatus Nanoarchaeia archaeon]
MNGILERAIENWLIKTNERSYQIPFCQILIAKGYDILYISPHGVLEFGKDIIAISPEGETICYQLKGGDLSLSDWNKYLREVYDLIDLKCKHPNVNKDKPHLSYIVTNGTIKDNVFARIDALNDTNTHYSKLKYIDKDIMLKMFLESNTKFLPQTFEDWGEFLSFFTLDGKDFFPKEKYFNFLKRNILIKTGKQISSFKNTIFSSVILTSYVLQNFQDSKNHYAQIEAWTILYSSLISFIEEHKIKNNKEIKKSLEIIQNEILELGKLLETDFLNSPDLLEGNIIGDGDYIRKGRITKLIGFLCCLNFSGTKLKDETKTKIYKNLKDLWIYGEDMFPHFFFIVKFLENENYINDAKELLKVLLKVILDGKYIYNKNNSHPLPSPYISLNELFEVYFCGKELDFKQFKGRSYILNPIINMMVKRDLREELEYNWRKISHIQMECFIPDNDFEYFNFRNKTGTNFAKFPKQTQSFQKLKEKLLQSIENDLLNKYEPILPFFILTYPYRINEEIIKILDK